MFTKMFPKMFTQPQSRSMKQIKVAGLTLSTISSLLGVAALSTPLASAATTTTTVDALATQMVAMGTKAHSGATGTLVAPVLSLMSQPGFDWNQVVFGTDTLTPSQQTTATALTPDIVQVASFSVTSQTAATALINDVIAKMQGLNPAIQSAEVVNFLAALEGQAATEMFTLLALQGSNGTLTQSMVAASVHTFFSSNVASAPTDVQTIFSASGVSGGAGGAGGGAGSTGGQGGSGGGSGTSLTTSTLGTLLKQVMVSVTGSTLSSQSGTTTLQLVVPANAFASSQQVSITTGSTASLPQGVPSGYQSQLAFGVSFGTTPAQPLTLTIQNAQIAADAKVYKITPNGWVAVPATVTAGQVVITFSADPDFVIVTKQSSGSTQKPLHLLPNQRVISLAGQTPAVVPGLVRNGTTYMPIWYVMHMLSSLNVVSHWNGTYWYLSSPTNMPTDLSNLQPGVGKMKVMLNGNTVLNVTGIPATDPSTKNLTTYMPIYDVILVLNRLHVKSTWDGTTWGLTQ